MNTISKDEQIDVVTAAIYEVFDVTVTVLCSNLDDTPASRIYDLLVSEEPSDIVEFKVKRELEELGIEQMSVEEYELFYYAFFEQLDEVDDV